MDGGTLRCGRLHGSEFCGGGLNWWNQQPSLNLREMIDYTAFGILSLLAGVSTQLPTDSTSSELTLQTSFDPVTYEEKRIQQSLAGTKYESSVGVTCTVLACFIMMTQWIECQCTALRMSYFGISSD